MSRWYGPEDGKVLAHCNRCDVDFVFEVVRGGGPLLHTCKPGAPRGTTYDVVGRGGEVMSDRTRAPLSRMPVTVQLPVALWLRVRRVAKRDRIKLYDLVRVAIERELLRRRK